VIGGEIRVELPAPREPALRKSMNEQDRTTGRDTGLDDVQSDSPPPVIR
jgi:hypothetical protein